MYIQNQIKRKLSESASIKYVCELLESKTSRHRTELANRVCEQFKFYDTRGQVQTSGCVKILRELESAGHFTLPTTAWRIMLLTLMGRETPELPAELLFSDIELRTLKAYAKKKD